MMGITMDLKRAAEDNKLVVLGNQRVEHVFFDLNVGGGAVELHLSGRRAVPCDALGETLAGSGKMSSSVFKADFFVSATHFCKEARVGGSNVSWSVTAQVAEISLFNGKFAMRDVDVLMTGEHDDPVVWTGSASGTLEVNMPLIAGVAHAAASFTIGVGGGGAGFVLNHIAVEVEATISVGGDMIVIYGAAQLEIPCASDVRFQGAVQLNVPGIKVEDAFASVVCACSWPTSPNTPYMRATITIAELSVMNVFALYDVEAFVQVFKGGAPGAS